MKINIREYNQMLTEHHIQVLYSGPLWSGGIDGIAEMLLKRLEFDEMPLTATQSVFSRI